MHKPQANGLDCVESDFICFLYVRRACRRNKATAAGEKACGYRVDGFEGFQDAKTAFKYVSSQK